VLPRDRHSGQAAGEHEVPRDAPVIEHDPSERYLTEAQKRELLDSLSPEDRDALTKLAAKPE
jgi:hypothetical protein